MAVETGEEMVDMMAEAREVVDSAAERAVASTGERAAYLVAMAVAMEVAARRG